MKKTLFLIVGRTASGKSTLARYLAEKHNKVIVKSYTDRPARPGETEENSDHIFISKDKMGKIINKKIYGRVAAYTKIGDVRYCTTEKILDKSDVYVIDPNGVKDLKINCGDKYKYVVIYISSSREDRIDRFKKRGGDLEKFLVRDEAEDHQFTAFESGVKALGYYEIRNSNLNSSKKIIDRIVKENS